MDTALKEEIVRLVDGCKDIHQLIHIKQLLESERTTALVVNEPTVQMAVPNIKQVQREIAVLMDDENDVDFLQDIKNEIDPNYIGDFSELSTEDREELLELINEPFGKDTISHEEFLKSMARWDTK